MNKRDLTELIKGPEREKTFRSLLELVISHGERTFSVTIGREEKKTLTYADLGYLVDKSSANLLSQIDLPLPRTLALCLHNNAEWVILFFSILKSGFNVLLLDFSMDDESILDHLRHAGCFVLISNGAKARLQGIRHIDYKEIVPRYLPEQDRHDLVHNKDWGTEVYLISSGSTGRGKICVHTQEGLIHGLIHGLCHGGALDSKEVANENAKVLALAPFSLLAGLTGTLLFYLISGKTLVFTLDFSPNFIKSICQNEGITTTFAVDSVFRTIIGNIEREVGKRNAVFRCLFLLMRYFSLFLQLVFQERGRKFAHRYLFQAMHKKILGNSIETIACGGSSIAPSTLRYINSLGWMTMNGYGMTETGVISVETSRSLRRRISGSVGLPSPTLELHLERLPGQIGPMREICLKGPQLCKGHLFEGKLIPLPLDSKGLFHTGDIGMLKANKGLFITGRIKDVIVLGNGKKVIPQDIEFRLSSTPENLDYCILGTKTRQGEEEISAAFCLKGQDRTKSWTEEHKEAIRKVVLRVNRGLPLHRRVKSVFLLQEEMPLTPSKKIQKFKVKSLIEEGNAQRVIKFNLSMD